MSRMRALVAVAVVVVLGWAARPGSALAGQADAAGRPLTIRLSWQTPGTDLDLYVVEPNGDRCCVQSANTRSGGKLLNDCQSGPGEEKYVHPNPPSGSYRIEVENFQGGPTEAVVQVLLGDQVIATHRAAIGQSRTRVLVATVPIGTSVPAGPPGPVQPQSGALSIAVRWETPGSDIDLAVFEPTAEAAYHNQPQTRSGGRLSPDVQSGPGEETYVHPNPPQGYYGLFLSHAAGKQPTPVAIQIRRGAQVVGSYQATLQPGQVRRLHTLVDQAPAAPNTAAVGAAGDLVVTLAWQAENADVDLRVLNDEAEQVKPGQDARRGPAKESCAIRQAPYGQYHIWAGLDKPQPGQTVPVTVGIQCGGKPVGTYTATLSAQSPSQHIQSLCIRPTPASPDDYVVVTQWNTQKTDVDAYVVGPANEIIRAETDVRSGPGKEVCVLRSPAPGEYKVHAAYYDDAGGQPTPVSVQVLRGDRPIGQTATATLTRSREDRVTTTFTIGGVEDGKPDLYVLTAGIAEYPRSGPNRQNRLLWCAKDAERLSECLATQEGKVYRKVLVCALPDEKATRANLSAARSQFLSKTRPQDVVLIFLSGHGNEHCFCAYDGPYSWQQVRNDLMAGLTARRVALMLDTCHAGGIGPLLTTFSSGPPAPGPTTLRAVGDELAETTGCFVYMSSNATQPSEEFFDHIPEHREVMRQVACFPIGDQDPLYDVFAFAVIDGLRGAAADPDGTVTAMTLMAHVDRILRLVRERTAALRPGNPINQQPCFIVPSNSHDFPLASYPHLRRTAPPASAPRTTP